MPVAILHVSGPACAGKTAIAAAFAASCGDRPVYHLRVDAERDDVPALRLTPTLPAMRDARRVVSAPGVVFEVISAAVGDFAASDPDATIIVETNNDPCFRHGYPWDVQIFLVPPPPAPRTIFRTQDELANSIRAMMHDTNGFAAAMFGLEHGPGDSSMLPAVAGAVDEDDEPMEIVEAFLASDIGADIICRMRLQSEYQGLLDSDIVLLNEANGLWTGMAAEAGQLVSRFLEVACG